ncbi:MULTISPECIES: type I secretion system permease/ATPase [Pseudoalteromonas]|uniref:Type I secretion system permease/ATPase n=1 Tax=Pseudoalteromonas haloplanktis TaxID=228 RepID=A0ABU1BI53_PSEHA|nr:MULTISPECIES: type I secretion system permease/ATPase [Pseudoalteromonas]MCF6144607.1 ATP-binding cassette, subfamily C, bacterial LapB [Pseudoalteromonas mariniglutinosa NCIMB 1770]MDQ9094121.1 type I secretion system permease/ATPase [Pseudoalteromonas haloplanktis]TMN71484.1 type I secretion system permease/ATPase [Pseudoalteromonas sp. S1727]BDF95049.1 ABC transporter [Pseudoalteromonas sp. KAN5]
MEIDDVVSHGGILVDCLEILCHYHDREFSRETLLNGLPLEQGNLTPSGFSRAAKRIGFKTKVVNKQLTKINTALLPAILLLENNQACVITALDPLTQTVEVIYPELSDSAVTLNVADLSQNPTDVIIYTRPEFTFDARSPVLQKLSKDGWFWGVIKECRSLYKDVIISAIALGVLSIAMPLFVMNVYDRVVPNQAVETLWVLAIGVLIALTADFALRLVRSYFVELAASRIDVKVSAVIMERVLGMQLKNRPTSAGSFASNIQSFEAVRGFFSSITLIALVDLPFVFLYLTVIAIIGVELSIPIIVGAIILLCYALAAHRKLEALSEQTMKASSMRNAILVESLTNIEDVKSFHSECKTQAAWEKSTIYIARVNAQSRLISGSIANSATWLQQCVGVIIMIIGVHLVIAGDLTQGGLIAAYLLSSRTMGPIGQSAAVLAQFHHAAIAMHSLNEIMEKEVERPAGKHWLSHPVLRGDIEFQNVHFKYSDESNEALSGVSFKIKAGEKVAILGRNGSGKSTLEKLILGLHDPTSGSILIDNTDIHQIDPAELRHNIGYVPQTISLFFGSLKDNITLSAWHAKDEQIISACERSQLFDLINSHPDGFDLQVGEQGRLLSGGQRQAVGIARALINDPPILILDEPTSALDHNSEAKIIANLKQYNHDKTLLVVTHRTSLLELVDRIIVVDNGKIIADGPKARVIASLSNQTVERAS